MKKVLGILCCLLLMVSFSFLWTTSVQAEEVEEVIDYASLFSEMEIEELEEIGELLSTILNEKRVANAKLSLDDSEVNIGMWQQKKLTYTCEGREITPQVKVTWKSSDDTVVTVQNGTVSGKSSGEATITCEMVFEDSAVLCDSCIVRVIVPVTSVQGPYQAVLVAPNSSLSLAEQVTVQPMNATDTSMSWQSDNTEVATVTDEGVVTGANPGKCVITGTTVDGSNKSVSIKVTVPSIAITQNEYNVTSQKGATIDIPYYGSTPEKVKVQFGGYAAEITMNYTNDKLQLKVVPNNAGTENVTLIDEFGERVTLKIIIDHSAVYDTISYPLIDYKNASRYPDQYKGKNVRFSGKVLQVIDTWLGKAYRISSSGSWDNVVYVLDMGEDSVPLIEDDYVTVFGTYAGNMTYETVMGAKMTIPEVYGEKIKLGY